VASGGGKVGALVKKGDAMTATASASVKVVKGKMAAADTRINLIRGMESRHVGNWHEELVIGNCWPTVAQGHGGRFYVLQERLS
jgi:hypothetical protein